MHHRRAASLFFATSDEPISSTARPRPRRAWAAIVRWSAIAAGYVLLTVALTWPLASQAATHLPRDLGDPLLTAWLLSWHATVPPFTETWWNGAAFFPLPDTLALSDHRVGLSLVATPVLWLGGTPALAYNVTLILGFALSALTMHALAYRLTVRHDAALVAGLAFGFAPYRFDHLEHLELTATWWLPMTLLGLHAWHANRGSHGLTGSAAARQRPSAPRPGGRAGGVLWLLLASTSWMLQGLTGGYYFVFGLVLLGLWVAWFVHPRDWRIDFGPLVAAFGVALVPLLPILWRYHAFHQRLGLMRTLEEVERYSADLSGLLSRSAWLDLIPGLAALQRPEGQLYPGLIAIGLVAAALWRARRATIPLPTRRPRIRQACLVVAAAAIAVAAVTAAIGPWRLDAAGLDLRATRLYKPVTVAMLALIVFAMTSPRLREAWRTRSSLAFYALATPLFWSLSLGPTGHLVGERFWYQAPYAWLMLVPGMSHGFRVPARFGMLAGLTLAVAAGLAFSRVARSHPQRGALAAALCALLLADVWPGATPMVAMPVVPDASAIRRAGVAVVELPLGRVADDALAHYRQLTHHLPVVNGYSGHEPPHYALLRLALGDHDPRALDAWRRDGRLLVGLDASDRDGEWARYVTGLGARDVGTAGDRRYFALDPVGPAATPPCAPLTIGHIQAGPGEDVPTALHDGRVTTTWSTRRPQQGGESLRIDLGGLRRVCGLRLVQGRQQLGEFPRRLEVAASADGVTWTHVWVGQTAGLAVEAALHDPLRVAIEIPMSAGQTRYLRVRQAGTSGRHHWAAAEVEVLGGKG